jgi:hypothetical protein
MMALQGATTACAVFLAVILASTAVRSETRTYMLAIGNNALPPQSQSTQDEGLRPLQYADDDASAVTALGRDLGYRTTLLTVADAASQRRFPELIGESRPPTLVELRRAVGQLKRDFEADRRAGDQPVLFFFFSGHGAVPVGGSPFLALLDGPLTQSVLYDEVLAELPARYVHLVIDACHAEAIVRPRDTQARSRPLGAEEMQQFAARRTLARFPHVGAVIATSDEAQTHEWNVYQQGVFTYELLSGLRGAADVNRDGRIEYSELYAFLGAANRAVVDPRARLSIAAYPPSQNQRVPLVEFPKSSANATLAGPGPASNSGVPERFFLEDELGNRLAELRPEPGYQFTLLVPAGRRLFLRTSDREAVFTLEPGEARNLGTLRLAPVSTVARDAIASSLHRGLFATPFGPRYYVGFVDGHAELLPVDLNLSLAAERDLSLERPGRRSLWNGYRKAALVAGMVGLSGLVVATVWGARFSSRNEEANKTCPGGACDEPAYSKATSLWHAAKDAQTIAWLGGSVGGAAFITGILLFLYSGRPHRDQVTVTPSLSASSQGLQMSGVW